MQSCSSTEEDEEEEEDDAEEGGQEKEAHDGGPPRLRPYVLMENKDGSWRVLSRRVSQEYVAVVLWARNKHLERMWRLIKGPHDTTSPPWEIELDPSFVTDAHQSLKEHWMPELLAEYKARKGKPATKPQQRQIYSLAPIATTPNLKRWVGTCCGRSVMLLLLCGKSFIVGDKQFWHVPGMVW